VNALCICFGVMEEEDEKRTSKRNAVVTPRRSDVNFRNVEEKERPGPLHIKKVETGKKVGSEWDKENKPKEKGIQKIGIAKPPLKILRMEDNQKVRKWDVG